MHFDYDINLGIMCENQWELNRSDLTELIQWDYGVLTRPVFWTNWID